MDRSCRARAAFEQLYLVLQCFCGSFVRSCGGLAEGERTQRAENGRKGDEKNCEPSEGVFRLQAMQAHASKYKRVNLAWMAGLFLFVLIPLFASLMFLVEKLHSFGKFPTHISNHREDRAKHREILPGSPVHDQCKHQPENSKSKTKNLTPLLPVRFRRAQLCKGEKSQRKHE